MVGSRQTALATVIWLGLGLAIGLADLQRLVAFPAARFREFQSQAHPHAVRWAESLEGLVALLGILERPRLAFTVAILIGALFTLAQLLARGPGILKDDRPETGLAAHVELSRLPEALIAFLVTIWLLGSFHPLAGLVTSDPWIGALMGVVLGGVPGWVEGVSPMVGPLVSSLLAAVVFGSLAHLLWGQRGCLASRGETPPSTWKVLLTGAISGAAAWPAVVALLPGRAWLGAAGSPLSLADRSEWLVVMGATLLLPALGMFWWLASTTRFRPDGISRTAATFCVLGPLLVLVAYPLARRSLDRADIGELSLARKLGLPGADLPRWGVVLTPDGAAAMSTPQDGSQVGDDRIVCNGDTVRAVEEFLAARKWRTQLADRAFIHLFDCSSLDWLPETSLSICLRTLERWPTPVASQLMLERLTHCPISPETRRYLDALADPNRFRWDSPAAYRWLAAAYMRFGDSNRAREFAAKARLNESELRQFLGGVAPLTEGRVSGEITVLGARQANVRLGLVPLDQAGSWRRLLGPCRAFEWRQVITSTHTNEQGQFEFTQIPEGRYLLIVTGGGIGRRRGRPVASGHPGPILLDRLHASIKLKPIDLDFRPEPPGMPNAPRIPPPVTPRPPAEPKSTI